MASVNPAELANTALFAGLDEPARAVVADWLEIEEVPAGRNLTREGAAGYAFSVLHEGAADVVVHGTVVRTLGPGDFFGELAMLGDGRRTATVTATTPAVVWTMFGTRFRELQQQYPEIAASIERVAAERLREG